jgi:iron complex outermembrane receptor protein
MKTVQRLALLSSLLAYCLPLSAATPSETDAANPNLQLSALSEEDFLGEIPVVLTATRLAQPLTEAPAAITIIDQQMIKASGARDIADLFRLVPGFIVNHDSGHVPIVSYHGLSDEFVKRLQVLVDGRSVYSPIFGGPDWSNLPLTIDDIARIEVIRGPNAASYGSNSFLSVINIITHHASETTGFFARKNRGTDGISDTYLRYGNTTGDLDYRLTLGLNKDDGFEGRGDSRDIRTARFRADYQLTAADTLLFELGRTRGSKLIDSDSLSAMEDRDVRVNFEQLRWQRQIGSRDEISLQFFHTVENNDEIFDVTRTFIAILPPIHVIRDSSTHAERFDIEAQHTKQINDMTRLVWGGNIRQDTAKGPQIFGTDPAVDYTGNKDSFDNQLYRVFANLEWRIKADLTANIGTMWEKSDLAEAQFSPRIGFNYLLTPQQSVRIIASRATRSPSLNETYSDFRVPFYDVFAPPPYCPSGPPCKIVARIWVGNENLKPEKITAYELGYHANLLKQHIGLDIKYYQEQLRDLIVFDQNTVPNPSDPIIGQYLVYDNLTDADIDGIEASLEFQPRPESRLIISHSYTEIDSQNPNISSKKLADSAPAHTTSILAINQFADGILGSINYFRANESNGLGSGDPVPGYRRLDIRISAPFQWHHVHGELAFIAQNIADDYLDWRSDNLSERIHYVSLSAQWE